MDDVLALIREIEHPAEAPGTVTTAEIARAAGCGRAKALRIVHELVATGKLRPAAIPRVNMHGELHPVKGYEIL